MKASETTEPTLQQVAAIVCGLPPEAELEWMERNMPRKVERAKEILTLFSRSPVKATKCVSPGGCVAGKGDPPMDCGYPDCQVPVKDAAPAPVLTEAAQTLAILALQSDRYASDPDFRDAVDDVIGLTIKREKRLTKQAPVQGLTAESRADIELIAARHLCCGASACMNEKRSMQGRGEHPCVALKNHSFVAAHITDAIVGRLTAPQPEENV